MPAQVHSRTMEKSKDAFLTIGELSAELGVPQHVLRYWETRFPQLKPLQRSGNRRYYRPADIALVRRIHVLLSEQGYTVRGAQQALRQADNGTAAPMQPAPTDHRDRGALTGDEPPATSPRPIVAELRTIRAMLARALDVA